MARPIKENIVDEWCANCETEVQLKATLYEKQHCPNCGNPIKPCALCDWDNINCNECPWGFWGEELRKGVRYKLISPIPIYFAE